MVDCAAIKKAIIPKTLNKFTFTRVIFWFVVGVTLCIVYGELESIQCVTGNNPDSDFIHRKCYADYRMQNHKLGIHPLLFVTVNVLLIPTVTVIYSQ